MVLKSVLKNRLGVGETRRSGSDVSTVFTSTVKRQKTCCWKTTWEDDGKVLDGRVMYVPSGVDGSCCSVFTSFFG